MKITPENVQKVIDRIKTEGWTQHIYGESVGPACISKHIGCALGYPLFIDFIGLIHKKIGDGSIVVWNDQEGMTKEKIISTLEEIQEDLRETIRSNS